MSQEYKLKSGVRLNLSFERCYFVVFSLSLFFPMYDKYHPSPPTAYCPRLCSGGERSGNS